MSELVIDASVAVKWLVSETLSEKAVVILERPEVRIAPTLLLVEVARVLRKKVRGTQLTPLLARERLSAFDRFNVALFPVEPIIELAFTIAMETDRTVYDSVYVALAEARGCPLITADERLFNALKQQRPATKIIWLGSL